MARTAHHGAETMNFSGFRLPSMPVQFATPLSAAQWEAAGQKGLAAFDSVARKSSGSLFIGRVAGTGHFSFSDGPFTMPTTITRFGGKIIDGTRGWTVITTTVRAYFEAVFGGRPAEFPGDLTTRFPELTLTRVGGA